MAFFVTFIIFGVFLSFWVIFDILGGSDFFRGASLSSWKEAAVETRQHSFLNKTRLVCLKYVNVSELNGNSLDPFFVQNLVILVNLVNLVILVNLLPIFRFL